MHVCWAGKVLGSSQGRLGDGAGGTGENSGQQSTGRVGLTGEADGLAW